MQNFTGATATLAARAGFSIATPRGALDMMTPPAFLDRFGVEAPVVNGGARLAALRFTAANANLLDAVPELAGLGGLYAGNATVIAGPDAMGAVLVFEPAR
jgi:hypothetical protein